MKTVKNMWAHSKPLTVITLIMGVVVLVALVMAWWAPVYFGYPWYAVVVNLAATSFAASVAMSIAGMVND